MPGVNTVPIQVTDMITAIDIDADSETYNIMSLPTGIMYMHASS